MNYFEGQRIQHFGSETGLASCISFKQFFLELYHGTTDNYRPGDGCHFQQYGDSIAPAISPIKSPKRPRDLDSQDFVQVIPDSEPSPQKAKD